MTNSVQQGTVGESTPRPPSRERVRLGAMAQVVVSSVDKHSRDGELPVRLCNYTDVYHHDRLDQRRSYMKATASAEQIARFRLEPHDVIITKDSETADDIGVPALITESADDFVCGYHLAILRPDPRRADGRYLNWALQSADLKGQFENIAFGVTRAGLKTGRIKTLQIPVPGGPEEQRRIADYLDRETARIDALIEKQRELIARLRERAKALLRSGVFGAKQSGARLDRWIPELSAGWSIEPLRRHTRLVNGATPNRANPAYWRGGKHGWLNSSHANSDVVVGADQWVTDAAMEECHLPRLSPGTVLVAITGQGKTRGKATLLEVHATINQHLAGVIPAKDRWDARYLTLMLRAAYNELRLISDAGGSTRGALTLSSLGNILVARPPLAEQRAIADHLHRETAKIDALIAKAERFIELAQERRAALITAAVTGQIDVPAA